MKLFKQLTVVDLIAFLFSFLFIYASISKLVEYHLFVAQIGKSPLITRYVDTISWLVPTSELLIVALLYVPRLRLAALYASFTTMFAFTIYIIMILTLSPYVPCSCGGILNKMGWTEHLVFNIAFTLLALVGIYFEQRVNTEKIEFHQTAIEL